MAADGIEKFEVTLIVSVFILVMLNDHDADGGAGSFERNAKPRGGRGADEFDFAFGSETVEFRLWNRAGFSGSKDVRHAGSGDFLRRRRRIELIHEKREVEHFRLRIVEGHEKVLGVDNFFERVVNLEQQFIEVGGLIEGVNDVGEDQALRLHALNFGDVLIGDEDALNIGIGDAVGGDSIEPAKLAGLGAEAAATRNTLIVGSGENWLSEMSTDQLKELFALSREAVGE